MNNKRRVGVTGPRMGATAAQEDALRAVLPLADEVHHGDCVGVDELAHNIADDCGLDIVVHPPDNPRLRAWCYSVSPTIVQRDPKPYLERNRDIVDETALLVAVPDGPERRRSGTWYTINYARDQGKMVLIIPPDGDDGDIDISSEIARWLLDDE